MGATAREAGFSGDFRELYRPRVNLDLAVRHLRQLYARHDGNLFDAIASYHAGDPRSTRAVTYAHRVLALAMHYREVERE
jgi:soluble lytic murein transglycosylase-like protein